MRKTTRRRLVRAGFIILALVVLMPKMDLSALPQLTAMFGVAGLELPTIG
ncbi:hypothetical protein [Devosia lucknowensis]|nr:hypothetical protein [Devosia lucknowensis]